MGGGDERGVHAQLDAAGLFAPLRHQLDGVAQLRGVAEIDRVKLGDALAVDVAGAELGTSKA
jgi:hypothetical protein